MEDTNHELERFRTQWREEVTARAKGTTKRSDDKASRLALSAKATYKQTPAPPPPPAATASITHDEDEGDRIDPKAYHDLDDSDDRRRLNSTRNPSSLDEEAGSSSRSALEHYEKAVERESQGNLGDSLNLYRKAYRVRLDLTKPLHHTSI